MELHKFAPPAPKPPDRFLFPEEDIITPLEKAAAALEFMMQLIGVVTTSDIVFQSWEFVSENTLLHVRSELHEALKRINRAAPPEGGDWVLVPDGRFDLLTLWQHRKQQQAGGAK